jgi:hypothetical protein
MHLVEVAVSYGTLDISPWLELLVPKLEEMRKADAVCYSCAGDGSMVSTTIAILQSQALHVLELIAKMSLDQPLAPVRVSGVA